MKTTKILTLVLALLLIISHSAFANDELDIFYTKEVYPGDAIVIKVILDTPFDSFSADATLYASGVTKDLISVDLYEVSASVYSAIVPLSSWYESGDFSVTLAYNLNRQQKKKYTYQ